MPSEKKWAGRRGAGRADLEVLEGGSAERTTPASEEAERHLLSCCLMDAGQTLSRCQQERLTVEAFFFPRNKLIFGVLLDLWRAGSAISVEVLAEELRTRRLLEAAGGMAYLLEVSGFIPTTAHASYFVEVLKEKWILRDLIRDAEDAVEKCYAHVGGDLEELLAPLAGRFNRAIEYVRHGQEGMKEIAARGFQRTMLKLEGKQDKSRQLLTGMREFDERFGAFDVLDEDFLIGIAALTSGGKSAFTRKICDRFLRDGKKGMVFVLETGIAKWLDLAAATAVRMNFRQLDAYPKDKKELYRAARQEREAWLGERLWLCEDSLKVETLVSRVEDHCRQHGRLDFVVVDHLHELYSSEKRFRGQREQELGYMAKLLKKTAKALDVPFFVPTQLNRSPNKDGVLRRPNKNDLRGSGEIENAYDRLILLHVPKEDMRGAEQTENQARVMVEIIQDKSRNGPIGRREFWFDRPFTDYVEIRDHEFERKPNTPGGVANSGGYKR